MLTFQQIIFKLQNYWADKGCTVIQPFDMEVGAGTSHPGTCLRALGPEPWFAAYVQPSRRPKDGRYGDNPNRLQHYYQFQVALKPAPANIQDLYLDSLRELGIDPKVHDIRFVEDDWENPTLGAWGLGWEVWLNGMEVTQFTYFQQVGGIDCSPVLGEITYGIERLAMYLQGVENVYDLVWAKTLDGNIVTYGDVYHQNEVEQSTYNFEYSDADWLLRQVIDKYGTFCPQIVHDEFVVNDLMADVNRRAELFECTFNNADGAVNAGTKAAGIGKDNGFLSHVCSVFRRPLCRLKMFFCAANHLIPSKPRQRR